MSPCAKIDTHCHFLPPEYRDALAKNGHTNPDGMPAIPEWSVEGHLKMMKLVNVTKSYLSISTPGTDLVAGDNALARKLTRHVNDYAGELKKNDPQHFGFFASLALQDFEGSLLEIPHVFKNLNADGVTVMTNLHGSYLGHKDFDPIFNELNRRHAIVFIHPTTPCLSSGTHATPIAHVPRPMFEFLFDTARAVINLFLSGTVSRCPNITWLVPHCGGAFPPLINRFASIAPIVGLTGADPNLNPKWVKEQLNNRFYFDTAGFAFPEMIKGLLEYVTVDRILFGSDFPYTNLKYVETLSEQHDQHLPHVFPEEEDREKVNLKNAVQLFARKSTSL
ncbi:aminocarboxymuconate-semialdehyde decarboxylase [Dactylonectria estremocensis]|uniref:6-methylsalicylate decarboxylase n=1 Tax=Dactylonectria estremocensis TaxID=1079267 RepID=A0A9P9J0W4_9HYPO|nr:aminocarboxymuconate-semialdehyde decarboxylase [Dactylonectria estremocensis]